MKPKELVPGPRVSGMVWFVRGVQTVHGNDTDGSIWG